MGVEDTELGYWKHCTCIRSTAAPNVIVICTIRHMYASMHVQVIRSLCAAIGQV